MIILQTLAVVLLPECRIFKNNLKYNNKALNKSHILEFCNRKKQ